MTRPFARAGNGFQGELGGALPARRQQLVNTAIGMHRQTREHIGQINQRFDAIHLGRLNQAHDLGGACTGDHRATEEPIFTTNSPRPNLVFDTIVVHGQACIAGVAHQRGPTLQGVIHRLGHSRAIGELLTRGLEPIMQRCQPGDRLHLATCQGLLQIQTFIANLALHRIQRPDMRQCSLRQRALGCHMQLQELAPHMRPATHLDDRGVGVIAPSRTWRK